MCIAARIPGVAGGDLRVSCRVCATDVLLWIDSCQVVQLERRACMRHVGFQSKQRVCDGAWFWCCLRLLSDRERTWPFVVSLLIKHAARLGLSLCVLCFMHPFFFFSFLSTDPRGFAEISYIYLARQMPTRMYASCTHMSFALFVLCTSHGRAHEST